MKYIKAILEKLCCKHEWEERYKWDVDYYFDGTKYKSATKILYCCKKCGKFKIIKCL